MHMNLLVSLPLLVLLQGTLPSAPTTHPSVAAHGAPSTLPPQNQTPEHLNTQHLNTEYRIPYRLDETQHLAVRAKLNGRGPYNFIVDTGAPAVFIAKDVAARCG